MNKVNHSPTDILSWMKVYKQVSKFVHSDITKLALIKNSLSGKDKKSTEHLNTVAGVINFIHEKYCKGDIVLNILTRQAYDLQEPWSPQISLKKYRILLGNNFQFL